MASNAEIKALAESLQVSLDAEQQQVADLLAAKQATNDALTANVTTLEETIVTLTAQVSDGGTAEERQAILDTLTALKADIEGTVSDTAPTEPVE